MVACETLLSGKCQNCGSSNLVEDKDVGEVVCRDCGLVVREQIINEGPEWRDFPEEGKERSRVGGPVSLSFHDKGLSTVIDRSNRDAFGRTLTTSARQQLYRLRKWNTRVGLHSSVDRNL